MEAYNVTAHFILSFPWTRLSINLVFVCSSISGQSTVRVTVSIWGGEQGRRDIHHLALRQAADRRPWCLSAYSISLSALTKHVSVNRVRLRVITFNGCSPTCPDTRTKLLPHTHMGEMRCGERSWSKYYKQLRIGTTAITWYTLHVRTHMLSLTYSLSFILIYYLRQFIALFYFLISLCLRN